MPTAICLRGAHVKVREFMTKSVITARTNTPLEHVISLLVKYNISRIVITDDRGRPVGIITEKDIVKFLSEDISGRGLDEIYAEEVMTKNLITVSSETDVKSVAKIMIEKGISSVVVIGEGGTLEGIITKTDLCRYFACHCRGLCRVSDYMTREVITVRPTSHIFKVAEILNKNKISRVVVVENGKPIGIITMADLVSASSAFKLADWLLSRRVIKVKGKVIRPLQVGLLIARNLMSHNPITISEDADLADAAHLMVNNGISGLPVIDKNGKLVGIITKTDIIKAVRDLS